MRARCLSDARRNGRTDLAVWRETGTVAQQETETLVRIGAQIRQSTPNRMRLSARRPLVAAEFGARGITVRRAPQPYDSLHANARRGGVDQPTQGMHHSRILSDEAWAASLGYAHHSAGAGAAFRQHESTRIATIPTRRHRKTRAGGHGLVDSRHVGPWKRDDIDLANAHTNRLEPRSTPRHAGHQASAC